MLLVRHVGLDPLPTPSKATKRHTGAPGLEMGWVFFRPRDSIGRQCALFLDVACRGGPMKWARPMLDRHTAPVSCSHASTPAIAVKLVFGRRLEPLCAGGAGKPWLVILLVGGPTFDTIALRATARVTFWVAPWRWRSTLVSGNYSVRKSARVQEALTCRCGAGSSTRIFRVI